MTDSYQIVFMTASDKAEADRIAEALVECGLAACVNMLEACRSVYRWQGELVKEPEVLLIAKTRREKFKEIEQKVSELHSYDVPEIIAIDLTDIARGYAGFLGDVLGP